MFKSFLIPLISVLMFWLLVMAGSDTDPHPFLSSDASCVECHRLKKIQVSANDTGNACSFLCLTCHKDIGNHHAINVRVKEEIPGQLILTSKKKLACITCHRLKNNRYDTSSWKAESLYENLFKSKKTYKTYYLAVKNNDGQLCKMCH